MARLSANRPDTALDEPACRRRALNALARREHSRAELERKLGSRGFASEVIAVTLDDLERTGLLDAGRFCESFVRTRIGKGQGPARIERELLERGIDAESAGHALQDSQDWVALAQAVRRRRFGDEIPEDYKERARQSRFLQYRGFSSEQIRAAMRRDPDFE
ncbi:MAG: regulatory protein RecX [Gammaproteobacteria bacterium]|jgi:regulatory protein